MLRIQSSTDQSTTTTLPLAVKSEITKSIHLVGIGILYTREQSPKSGTILWPSYTRKVDYNITTVHQVLGRNKRLTRAIALLKMSSASALGILRPVPLCKCLKSRRALSSILVISLITRLETAKLSPPWRLSLAALSAANSLLDSPNLA